MKSDYWWLAHLSRQPGPMLGETGLLFLPHPEGTELVLTHERFATEALRDMHLRGWGGCIDELEALLAA